MLQKPTMVFTFILEYDVDGLHGERDHRRIGITDLEIEFVDESGSEDDVARVDPGFTHTSDGCLANARVRVAQTRLYG